MFVIGGGQSEFNGFVGCINHFYIMDVLMHLSSKEVTQKSQKDEVVKEGCLLDDKCTPNPCQNGGICKQNSTEFTCDCDGTGYSGALCHASHFHRSCTDFFVDHPSERWGYFGKHCLILQS